MVTDSTLGTEISDESKYYTHFKDTIYCKLEYQIKKRIKANIIDEQQR